MLRKLLISYCNLRITEMSHVMGNWYHWVKIFFFFTFTFVVITYFNFVFTSVSCVLTCLGVQLLDLLLYVFGDLFSWISKIGKNTLCISWFLLFLLIIVNKILVLLHSYIISTNIFSTKYSREIILTTLYVIVCTS